MRNAAKNSVPWLSASLALACLAISAFVPASVIGDLSFDRQAILSGEIWRLWTGHLVHFSTQHTLLDSLVLFLVGSLAEKDLGRRTMGLGIVLGALLISCGLLLGVPLLLEYRGASGISMLLAVAAGASLWKTAPQFRKLLLVLGSCLFAKTLLDACGDTLGVAGLPGEVQVAWQAHVFGAVGGWLLLLTRGIGRSRGQGAYSTV